jgi:hypothetical protein
MARFADTDTAGMEARENLRKFWARKLFRDLVSFGGEQGYTDNQIDGAIDQLVSTFAAEWSIWILIGHDALITAIQNDATIGWLNTEFPSGSGVTVRTRLVNRLSNVPPI